MSPAAAVDMEERLIFAMGGGGFTMEPNNPLLDDFVLGLTGAKEPRVLFLPTASGDTTAQINAFQARFSDRTCVPEHVSLFRLRETRRAPEEVVRGADIVYVGGGSMRNLLAIWQAHGLDRLLVEAWRAGTVLAGLSAGAMCWFQAGITRSSGPPESMPGLGLLDGSLTVHADGEPERLPVWLAKVRDGTVPGGWAVDDGVGLLFRGRAARARSSAHGRVRAPSGSMRSPASSCAQPIVPDLLGDDRAGRPSVASTRPSRSFAACTGCAAGSPGGAADSLPRPCTAASSGAQPDRSTGGVIDESSFAGRTVLVTGASRGIGLRHGTPVRRRSARASASSPATHRRWPPSPASSTAATTSSPPT